MNKLLLIFLLLAISGIAFINPLNLGIQDWDQHYAYALFNNISIGRFWQLPLWNPYHCGGMPHIGNPQNGFLTPFYLPVFIFGPVLGYKFQFLWYVIAGFAGSYSLSRFYGITKTGSMFAGLVYVFSGLFMGPFASGMTVFFPLMLLPFLLLTIMSGGKSKAFLISGVISGLVLAVIFLGGFHYILTVFLFVFILCLLKSVLARNINYLLVFIVSGLVFIGISAVKLIPAAILSNSNPRIINEELSGYGLVTFTKSLLFKPESFAAFREWGIDERDFLEGNSYDLDENYLYVGVIPALMFLLGIFKKGKHHIELGILLVLFVWLSFGFNIFPSLYYYLRRVPFFDLLRVAQRYRFFFMIPAALFAAFGFDALILFFRKKIGSGKTAVKFLTAIVFLAVVFDLYASHVKIITGSFSLTRPEVKATEHMVQRCGAKYYDKSGFRTAQTLSSTYSDEFPYLIKGWATPNCYEPLPVAVNARCISDRDYRGEYFLDKGEGRISLISWSPGRIELESELLSSDILILNQNYSEGWNSEINGRKKGVTERDGLISAAIPEGKSIIKLYYAPWFLVFGMFISIFSLVGVCFFIWSYVKQKYKQV